MFSYVSIFVQASGKISKYAGPIVSHDSTCLKILSWHQTPLVSSQSHKQQLETPQNTDPVFSRYGLVLLY